MIFNGQCNPLLTMGLIALGLYFLLNKNSGNATPLLLGALVIGGLILLNGGIPGLPPFTR